MNDTNAGRPLGPTVPGWTARPSPPREIFTGNYARLEPFDAPLHADALFAGYAEDSTGAIWDYLAFGPFADIAAYRANAEQNMTKGDPLYFTLFDREVERPGGVASLMRIVPEHGVIEVGGIAYAPWFQRTRAATDAMYLFACLVFDRLGYRRYEWKCNNLNDRSKRAAERLGFRFEGVFRNHMVVKGRSRDTAWFSITEEEWPTRKAAYERWLDPTNFDADGRQKTRLGALMNATVE